MQFLEAVISIFLSFPGQGLLLATPEPMIKDSVPGTLLCSLRVGDINMQIDAAKGARITSLQCNGREFLIPRSIEPVYYGATCWPDPQAAWWPMDPAFDELPYEIIYRSGHRVHLIGKVGVKGLQMEKMFAVSEKDTSIEISYIIHNRSSTVQKTGVWELIRVNGGLSFFPGTRQDIFPASNLAGTENKEGICWYTYTTPSIQGDQKLYSFGDQGWITHVDRGLIFIKSYPSIPKFQIAPNQGEVEIFTNGRYVELETHGRYTALTPGESVQYRVKWFLRNLPEGIKPVSGDNQLVKYVRNLLHLTNKNIKIKSHDHER